MQGIQLINSYLFVYICVKSCDWIILLIIFVIFFIQNIIYFSTVYTTPASYVSFSMGAPAKGEKFPPFNPVVGSKLKRAKGSRPQDFRNKFKEEERKEKLWSISKKEEQRPNRHEVYNSVSEADNSPGYSVDVKPTGQSLAAGGSTRLTTQQSTRPGSRRPSGHTTRQSNKLAAGSRQPARGFQKNGQGSSFTNTPKRTQFNVFDGMISDNGGKYRHQKKLSMTDKIPLTPADSKQYFPKSPSLTYFPQNSVQSNTPTNTQKYPIRPQSFPIIPQKYPIASVGVLKPQTYPTRPQVFPTTTVSRPATFNPRPVYTQAPILFQPQTKPFPYQLSSAAVPTLFSPVSFGGSKKRRAPPNPHFKNTIVSDKPILQTSIQDISLIKVSMVYFIIKLPWFLY